jgi:hypothetical protein
VKYPEHFKPEGRKMFKGLRSMNPNNLRVFDELLKSASEHPELLPKA